MRVDRCLVRLPFHIAFSVLLVACGDSGDEPNYLGWSNNATADAGPMAPPPTQDGADSADGADNGGVPIGPVADGGVVGADSWCKVKAVFDANCVVCHDGEGTAGTPMGLTTYADLTAESSLFPDTKIYTRVGVRIHDTERPMPPQEEVSAADLALLDAWIVAGAPGSDAVQCAPEEDAGVQVVEEWPADCEEKYKFLANDGSDGPFTVRAGAQFYQDFTFESPWSGDVQGVAFKPVVNNKKVLHHYILYDGSGAFLAGWSPGKQETPLPPDVGLFLPANGSLKMTVHYYNSLPGAQPEQDASGVEVCITKTKRPKTSAVMPFAANPVAPPNARTEVSSTCTVRASQPIHIITSSPHMHGLGVHAKMTVQRANGQTEVIHDKPFNFEEQTTHPIDFVVNNGDRITTTCVYNNETGRAVGFGTKTEDEMCFNFAQYYPMCGMTCTQSDPFAELWSQSQGAGCPGESGGGGGLFGN